MKCRRFKQQMDAYLRDELPEDVRQDFEAHYFSCKNCFDQLRIRRALMQTNFELKVLNGTEKADPGPYRRRLALVAASLLIVVAAGAWGLQIRRDNLLNRVSRFSPPTIMLTETRNQQTGTHYADAVQAYQSGDYQTALGYLERIPASSRTAKIHFLSGICRLMMKDPSLASAHFERIIEAMDPSYFDEALFYKGIALLRQDRVSEAREVFLRLAGMFSPLKAEARIRLDMIEKAF